MDRSRQFCGLHPHIHPYSIYLVIPHIVCEMAHQKQILMNQENLLFFLTHSWNQLTNFYVAEAIYFFFQPVMSTSTVLRCLYRRLLTKLVHSLVYEHVNQAIVLLWETLLPPTFFLCSLFDFLYPPVESKPQYLSVRLLSGHIINALPDRLPWSCCLLTSTHTVGSYCVELLIFWVLLTVAIFRAETRLSKVSFKLASHDMK